MDIEIIDTDAEIQEAQIEEGEKEEDEIITTRIPYTNRVPLTFFRSDMR